jgi:hypothetical protein
MYRPYSIKQEALEKQVENSPTRWLSGAAPRAATRRYAVGLRRRSTGNLHVYSLG